LPHSIRLGDTVLDLDEASDVPHQAEDLDDRTGGVPAEW
jgi:hypothetical protein